MFIKNANSRAQPLPTKSEPQARTRESVLTVPRLFFFFFFSRLFLKKAVSNTGDGKGWLYFPAYAYGLITLYVS